MQGSSGRLVLTEEFVQGTSGRKATYYFWEFHQLGSVSGYAPADTMHMNVHKCSMGLKLILHKCIQVQSFELCWELSPGGRQPKALYYLSVNYLRHALFTRNPFSF